jgi:2-polyprenyl-3-methyl-5-hydroxy-6-metoxy-1,4-benzoquinol methylase
MTDLPDPDARAAYDRWHERLEVDTEADAPWQLMVERHLGPIAGQRILEIGCGRGGLAVKLASWGPAAVIAADYSEVAVAKARAFAQARGAVNLTVEQGDIQALDHPAQTFDAVISCETVEHVPEPRRAVAELARVLKPGGRLVLTTPNYLSLTGVYRAYCVMRGRGYTEGGQPINNLTMIPRTVGWVRAAGLHVEAVEGAGHYLPIPGRAEGPKPLTLPTSVARTLRVFALHSLVLARKR